MVSEATFSILPCYASWCCDGSMLVSPKYAWYPGVNWTGKTDTARHCGAVLQGGPRSSSVLYCTVLYCTVLYCTVLHGGPSWVLWCFSNAILVMSPYTHTYIGSALEHWSNKIVLLVPSRHSSLICDCPGVNVHYNSRGVTTEDHPQVWPASATSVW